MSGGRLDHQEDVGEATPNSLESNDRSVPAHSIWKTRLQPGQIRLFNLQLDGPDEIKGALEVFELESAPEYIAQSYVCGEGDYDKVVVVNGSSLHVKPNLFVALRQTKKALQKPNFSKRTGCRIQIPWLWVDAVCIHQADTKELEMQIRFMEHIYRKARSTFVSIGHLRKAYRLISLVSVWLAADAQLSRLQNAKDSGSPLDDQDRINAARSQRLRRERALQTEGDLSEVATQDLLASLKNRLSSRSGKADQSLQALHYLHPFWQACMQLFETEWFWRLWTYQELVLSRRLFVTLHVSVPWSRI